MVKDDLEGASTRAGGGRRRSWRGPEGIGGVALTCDVRWRSVGWHDENGRKEASSGVTVGIEEVSSGLEDLDLVHLHTLLGLLLPLLRLGLLLCLLLHRLILRELLHGDGGWRMGLDRVVKGLLQRESQG